MERGGEMRSNRRSRYGSDKIAPPTLDDLIAETRQTYDGLVEVGEDLMAFDIGDAVTVRRFAR